MVSKLLVSRAFTSGVLRSLFLLGLIVFSINTLEAQAPTITSFSPNVVTARTLVTINGTNFTASTNISFGGVGATSKVFISSTQIQAVVAPTTSGNVVASNGTGLTATAPGLVYVAPVTSPGTATASRIITDWGTTGYWSSTTTSGVSTNQPDTRHNLLGFTQGGTLYSTGVNDAVITSNGNVIGAPSDFRGLPLSITSGTTAGASNYLIMGTKIDGNPSATVYTSPAISGLTPRDNLIDGLKGLDIGTGVTNIPLGVVFEFPITGISSSAVIADAIPDLLVTQIADPAGAQDYYAFIDASGNIIGNPVSGNVSGATALGTYKVDLFSLPSGQPFSTATPNGNGSAGAGTRDIRILGLRLSDFGITAGNYTSITGFKLLTGGDSDPGFFAYNAASVTISAPEIVTQPVSQVVCPGVGNSATFSVVASGTGLTYQWRKNGVNIAGATSDTYTINPVVAGSAGVYSVLITNSFGTVISQNATLNAIFVSQPVSTETCRNAQNPLYGTASGLNVTYQWYSNTTASTTGGTLIAGATADNYNPPVSVAGTFYYYLVATPDAQSCAAITSTVATLTVTATPVAGTVSANPTICSGSTTVLSLTGQTGTIQWLVSTTFGGTYANVTGGSGATSANYTTPALTATRYFRARVSNGSCTAVLSNIITVTVNSASVAGTVSANQTVCTGSSTTVSVTGFTGTIQWQQSANGSTGWADVTGGSGATTSTYTTPTLSATTFYRAVVTNSPCTSATSSNVQVTVNQPSVAGTPSANPTICPNTSTSISLTGYTGSIQWQQSPDGSTGWVNVTGGSGATTATYTTATLSATTYYRAVVTNTPCASATSSTVTVTVSSTNTWVGITSTDWNTASNWSCNVIPDATIDANVPVVGTGLYPALTNATGTCRNLNISSGASLIVTGTGFIRIAGAINSSGTINVLDGGVNFLGTSAQQIPANVFQANFIKNLTINNAAGVTNNSVLSITGVLNPQSGVFTTGDQITLKSNASTTAMIAPVTGSVSGIMTIERYIPARRAFRFLTSPVDGATIRENWQEGGADVIGLGTDITGTSPITNGFDPSLSNNPSMFRYLNNNPGTGSNWVAVSNTNATNLAAGFAYRILVRGDRTVDQADNEAVATNTTIRSTGYIAQGDFVRTDLNQTAGGFSFIGNPYQAPLNMETVLGNLTNTTNVNRTFYYIWDPTINTRGGYVTVNVSSNSNNVQEPDGPQSSVADRFAQPGQAFFVMTETNGLSQIAFRESDKGNSTVTTQLFRSASQDPVSNIRMTLFDSAALAANSPAADGFVINFDPAYSNDADSMDAKKPINQDENAGMLIGDVAYSFQSRAMPVSTDVIPLTHTQYRHTQYTYRARVNGLSGATAYLQDLYLGTQTELANDGVTDVPFEVNAEEPNSISANRFQIVFEEALSAGDSEFSNSVSVYPNPVTDGKFFVKVPSEGDYTISLVNVLGQEFGTKNVVSGSNTLQVMPEKMLSSGVYMVRITNGNVSATKKLIVK